VVFGLFYDIGWEHIPC